MAATSGQVAANVRAELARRRISAARLAADIGWAERTTARRVAGASAWTIDQIEAVAGYLGVPVARLIGDDAA